MQKKDPEGDSQFPICNKAILQLASVTLLYALHVRSTKEVQKETQKTWKWKVCCLETLILISLVQ